MKKFIYALTTGLMLATGLTAQADTGVVLGTTGDSSRHAPICANEGFSLTQTLYTASEMSAATSGASDYLIQALTYTLSQTADAQGDVQIYMTAVDGNTTTLTSAIPEDQWTQVYTGSVTENNVVNEQLNFKLDTPFAMEAGKALVITTKYIAKVKAYWYFRCGSQSSFGSDIRTRHYEGYSEESLEWESLNGGSATWYPREVPSLTITYGQGEVSDSFKVAAELEGDLNTNVGKENTYKVRITNNAAVTLSDYNVALLVNNEEVATLAGPTVAAGTTEIVNLKYTYPATGTYSVVAKVWQGNILPSNTNDLNVTVDPYVPANMSTITLPEGESYDSSWRGQNFIDRSYVYSASQSIFPASYFKDFANGIDIYSMAIYVQQEYGRYPVDLEIYLAQTDRTESFTSDSSLVPEDAFTKVWSGTFNPAQNADGERTKCNFVLDQPFNLEKGKSLVMNVYMKDPTDGSYNPQLSVVLVDTEEAYMRSAFCNYISGKKPADTWMTLYSNTGNASFRSNKYLPLIDFGYTAAKAAEKIDLSIEAGSTWPTEGEAGKTTRFPVTVTNEGTVDIENFKVELLDYSSGDMDNPVVIYSEDKDDFLAPGGTTNVRIPYTFAQGGMYYLGARVVVEGDVNLENNYTEPEVFEIALPAIDLKITGFSGMDEVMAGEENEYEVTVENGGSERLSGNYTVEIIDEDDNVITSDEAYIFIPSGGAAHLAVPVTFNAAGFYEIRARINIEGDSDMSNNVSEPLEVVAYPNGLENDLEIVDFSYNGEPEDLVDNKEVEFEVQIFNAGLEPASGFVITIENADADQTLASETINMRLAAQQTGYYAIPVIFPSPKFYSLVAHVTYINDENEDNDWSDVITVEVNKNQDGVENIAAEIEAGNVYNVQGFRITNHDNLPAGIYIVNGKKVIVK